MSETLVSCPSCHTPNFTERGLKAHRCKGPKADPLVPFNSRNPETGLVEIVATEVLPPTITTVQTYASLSVAEINGFHRRATGAAEAARRASEEACHYALLAGTRLEQLRDSTPHGQWEGMFSSRALTSNPNQNAEWLGFDFTSETARKYMEAAKRIRLEQSMSAKAQKKLAAIADAPELNDESRAFLDKLTEGRTLRQLYLDLEIIQAKPEKEKPTEEKEKPAAKTSKTARQLAIEDAREAIHLFQESWTKLVKAGHLDDLPTEELPALQEFIATARDAVKARLK